MRPFPICIGSYGLRQIRSVMALSDNLTESGAALI
jgi:hypothetical protein